MKQTLFNTILLLQFIMLALQVNAQNQQTTAQADSAAITIKLEALNDRQKVLQDSIKNEDRKRNATINGVSPETMEQINDRQDSICLSLRSKLITVELEINELTPNKAQDQILQQYNTLLQQQIYIADKLKHIIFISRNKKGN